MRRGGCCLVMVNKDVKVLLLRLWGPSCGGFLVEVVECARPNSEALHIGGHVGGLDDQLSQPFLTVFIKFLPMLQVTYETLIYTHAKFHESSSLISRLMTSNEKHAPTILRAIAPMT